MMGYLQGVIRRIHVDIRYAWRYVEIRLHVARMCSVCVRPVTLCL